MFHQNIWHYWGNYLICLTLLLFLFHLASDGSNIAADQCVWQRTGSFTRCHGIHHIISAHSVHFGQTSRWISHRFVPGNFLDLLIFLSNFQKRLMWIHRYFRDYGKRFSCQLCCWWFCALVDSFLSQPFPFGIFPNNHRTISAKAKAPVAIHC